MFLPKALCFRSLCIYSRIARLITMKRTGARTIRAIVHDTSQVSEPMAKFLYVRSVKAWNPLDGRDVSQTPFFACSAEAETGEETELWETLTKIYLNIKTWRVYGSMPAKSNTWGKERMNQNESKMRK